MKVLQTFLLVLFTSLLVFTKTGYPLPSSSIGNSHLQALGLFQDGSTEQLKLAKSDESFSKNNSVLDDSLFDIDFEEEEEKQSKKDVLTAPNHFFKRQFSFNSLLNQYVVSHSGVSKGKTISETQSIRLHYIIQKIQV